MNKEDIYNAWLKSTAKANSRPYRRRKNFSDMKDEDMVALEKLSRVFDNFPGVDVDMYFDSGYVLRGEKYIPLSDFTRPSAVKDYKSYMYKEKEDGVSITEDRTIMGRIVHGFEYMGKICVKNGWKLSEYIASMDITGGITYQWVLDYADHHICEYNIIAIDRMGFDVAKAVRETIPPSEMETFFPKGLEAGVLSKIDTMDSYDLDLLVGLLKKINKMVKNAIDNRKGEDVQS